MSRYGNYKSEIPEEITFNKNQFDYEMRIIQSNAETVTITLRHYEDFKGTIERLKKENEELIHNFTDVLNKNEDYVLSENYASFIFSNSYFHLKKGINTEIDQLKDTIESLRDKANKKQIFWFKLKNIFK